MVESMVQVLVPAQITGYRFRFEVTGFRFQTLESNVQSQSVKKGVGTGLLNSARL